MEDKNYYTAVGKFIYGSCRYSGDTTAAANWIADDLGLARPDPGDPHALGELFKPFLAKYGSADVLQENWERFIETLKKSPSPLPGS